MSTSDPRAKAALADPIAPVDLAAERAELGTELEDAVLRTLRSGAFVLGPEVEGFEAEFAHYQRCAYGVGVASGTDALILAMVAAGVKRGDHVVTSPFTFFASAGTMAWIGAKPVFADVELDTALLDPKEAASAIDDKTTCILPIHLYGQLADMDAFSILAKKRGLLLLEDAAQAHGAERDGYRAGERSLAAGFSFYPTKNLGAAGDAGLVTTQHEEINVALRRLRDHGSPKKYEHASIGTNSRLASLQAACLRVKLPHLEEWNDRRRANAKRYDEAFANCETIRPLRVVQNSSHVYHQYTVRILGDAKGESGARDRALERLREQRIFASVHYPSPVHLQPALKDLGYGPGDFPNAERLCEEILCLPIHPFLSNEDVDRVAQSLIQTS